MKEVSEMDNCKKLLVYNAKSKEQLEKNAIVFFNGQIAYNCIKANAVEGWIDIPAINTDFKKNNYIYMNKDGDDYITSRIKGTVQIFAVDENGNVIKK